MPLKPYEEWAEGPLVFPVAGKTYTVPPLGWEAGVKLTAILNGEDVAQGLSAEDQNRLLMGDAWDQMVADGVPAEALSRAALTCLVDFRMGREAAERVWESGLSPEALAPAKGAPEPSRQPDTGSGNPTPSPASTRRTTSRRASSKKGGRTPKASASTTS